MTAATDLKIPTATDLKITYGPKKVHPNGGVCSEFKLNGKGTACRLCKRKGEYLIEHFEGYTKYTQHKDGRWSREIVPDGNWHMYGLSFKTGEEAIEQFKGWVIRDWNSWKNLKG